MSEDKQYSEEVVHTYDGIDELDNQLPRWWVLLFYICMIFAPIYMGIYHIFDIGDLSAAKYEKSVAAAEAAVVARTKAEDEAIARGDMAARPTGPSTDVDVLAKGQTLFLTHCVACHFMDGGGLVGPNLTDEYWLNGPTFADNLRTIQDGVPERGMIPWKVMLKPDDIQAVASHVWTLRGKTPANPKGAEGRKYDEQGLVIDEKPRLAAAPGTPAPATP
jgi:cytochrome c oxidase cbb3-type subunit 3